MHTVHEAPLFRQLANSPSCGRSWFSIGTFNNRPDAESGPVRHKALSRSLIVTPRDEAASRAFLLEDLRLNGPLSAVNQLTDTEFLSNSYESIGALAVALLHGGEPSRARHLLQRCVALAPDRLEAVERLGLMSLDSALYAEAVVFFRVATVIRPDDADLRSEWLLARSRAGERNCYHELSALADKEHRLQPLLNAGMASVDARLWPESDYFFRKALVLFPGSPHAWSKSGIPLITNNTPLLAKKRLERSLFVDPSWIEARVNLGRALESLGDFRGAICEYEIALRVRRDLAEPRLNAGTCYLGLGQFDRGWDYYSARWSAQSVVNFSRNSMSRYIRTSKPPLVAQASYGKVLVWSEQGIGDEIMFCSMLEELLALSLELVVTVDERLLPLFKRSFPRIRFFARQHEVSPELYDYHLPMGDLGGLFRRNVIQFTGRNAAYLKPDQSRIQRYRSLLHERGKILVGISWCSANPNTGFSRSVPLEQLARALDCPQAVLVSLQYGTTGGDEVHELLDRTGIRVICLEDLDLTDDLDGVAAVAAACDLVVSIGNAVAHLSAACGVRTWLLASVGGSWRWMFEGSRTPWYESVSIYRQQSLGNWQAPLQELASDFDALTTLIRLGDQECVSDAS